MSTVIAIILCAIGIGVLTMVVRGLLKKKKPATMPLTVFGIGLVGYNKGQLSLEQARAVANDLATIRGAALISLRYIYGIHKQCVLNKLTLDTTFYKPAEWTGIHSRHITVNPLKPKHRSHFAEEIHNLYRVEMYGYDYRYEPVDDEDEMLRETAQKAMRDL